MAEFSFQVTGTEYNPHPSTIMREFTQEGVVTGEGMGDALNRLIHHEIEWDMLDGDSRVTIEIEPDSKLRRVTVREITNRKRPAVTGRNTP